MGDVNKVLIIVFVKRNVSFRKERTKIEIFIHILNENVSIIAEIYLIYKSLEKVVEDV